MSLISFVGIYTGTHYTGAHYQGLSEGGGAICPGPQFKGPKICKIKKYII
jgi:hypothetical protein